MEFLKRKWGYLLLAAALAAAIALVCFLLFWNHQGDAYTDGLLVDCKAVEEIYCYE